MKKEIDMINGRLMPAMLSFSIPVILSSVLQTLYNAADSLIIGHYDSSYALGAVGSSGPIVNMFVNLFMGLSIGANVVVARFFGAGDKKRVRKASDTAVITALISGFLIGIIGFFASESIARMVKIDPEIIDMSILYMKILFIGMPFTALYNFIAATLRGIGDTRNPMIALVTSGAVNVVLNIIFVKYFAMSVAGVALATTISQCLAFIMVLIMLIKSNVGFSAAKIEFDNSILKTMVAVGVPSSIQSITFSLSNTMMISAINSFGASAAAGSSVESQISGIIYAAMSALTQTVTTFTSQNVGAGKLNRINKILFIGLVISIVETIALSLLSYSIKDYIIDIFVPGDAEAARFTVIKLRAIVLPYFLMCFYEIFSGMMRGMSATFSSMILSIIGICGVRLVWLLVLFPIHRTPEFLFASYPVSWIISDIMYVFAYISVKKRLIKNQSSS